jgi:hypothetical protein
VLVGARPGPAPPGPGGPCGRAAAQPACRSATPGPDPRSVAAPASGERGNPHPTAWAVEWRHSPPALNGFMPGGWRPANVGRPCPGPPVYGSWSAPPNRILLETRPSLEVSRFTQPIQLDGGGHRAPGTVQLRSPHPCKTPVVDLLHRHPERAAEGSICTMWNRRTSVPPIHP